MKKGLCGILVVTQLMGAWFAGAQTNMYGATRRQFCAINAETSPSSPATVRYTKPAIAVSPRSLDFASVVVGRPRHLTFTVQNVGAGTLTGAAKVSAPFRIVGGSPYVLGSSQSQVITVQYLPKATGLNMSAVLLTGEAEASITVAGSAVPAPAGPPGRPLNLRLLASR